jgi:hypothetical protein
MLCGRAADQSRQKPSTASASDTDSASSGRDTRRRS